MSRAPNHLFLARKGRDIDIEGLEAGLEAGLANSMRLPVLPLQGVLLALVVRVVVGGLACVGNVMADVSGRVVSLHS